MRLTIILPEHVDDALTAMADAEYRPVREQAAWLIYHALIAAGRLPADGIAVPPVTNGRAH